MVGGAPLPDAHARDPQLRLVVEAVAALVEARVVVVPHLPGAGAAARRRPSAPPLAVTPSMPRIFLRRTRTRTRRRRGDGGAAPPSGEPTSTEVAGVPIQLDTSRGGPAPAACTATEPRCRRCDPAAPQLTNPLKEGGVPRPPPALRPCGRDAPPEGAAPSGTGGVLLAGCCACRAGASRGSRVAR